MLILTGRSYIIINNNIYIATNSEGLETIVCKMVIQSNLKINKFSRKVFYKWQFALVYLTNYSKLSPTTNKSLFIAKVINPILFFTIVTV